MVQFLIPVFVGTALATTPPLFQQGPETFQIVDTNSKPIKLRILNGSLTKQSFAMALNSVLKFSESKSDVHPYVDLKIEKLILQPEKKNSDKIEMTLLVSGREFDLAPTISKSELISGKTIEVKIPSKNDDVAVFSVTSKGHFSLKYDANSNVLFINNAVADLQIESPLSEDESETIKFNGKGLRK